MTSGVSEIFSTSNSLKFQNSLAHRDVPVSEINVITRLTFIMTIALCKSKRIHVRRLFMLVSICIYGLLHYRMLARLSADSEKPVRKQQHRHHENGLDRVQINSKQEIRLKRSSSIDYFSCCGAGHRLSKLADAYYAAKKLEFTVRVFFGFCSQQEVFSYLFGPRPLNENQVLDKINAGFRVGKDMNILPDMYIKVSNEVPGFKKITRYGVSTAGYVNTTNCPCPKERFNSDVELFTDLRDNRFRARGVVESFRRQFFVGKTVIGLHVRAGNGEKEFLTRGREIGGGLDEWCRSMTSLLTSLSNKFHKEEPPILFVASDTVKVISRLREMLKGRMEVIDFKQERIDDGQGVLFGAVGDVNNDGDQCKNGWLDSFTDMMLLSYADVLVAGRPSSFTQSLPMTLTLSTPKAKRKVLKSYCEVDPNATAFMCFEDLEEWCCKGNTTFSLHEIQNYDYRRMPEVGGLNLEEYTKQLKMRPRKNDACIPTTTDYGNCLPFEMPSEKSLLKLRKRQTKKNATKK